MSPGPLVSVIVPLYNGASTIERALASVTAQSCSDWELIVIDDASTDDSVRRAQDFATQTDDRRIRIIETPTNRGSSSARNTGIDAAAGEFMTFLDADDEMLPDYLEVLTSACDAETDIVTCGHLMSVEGAEERPRSSRAAGRMDGLSALRAALADTITPFPWDKLYRRSLFDGLRYPEGLKRFEDMVVNLCLYPRARHVMVLHSPHYRYQVSRGSLTWARVPPREDIARAIAYLDQHLSPELREGPFRAPFQAMLTLLTLLVAQSAATAESQEQLRPDLRQYGQDLPFRQLVVCATVRPDLAAAGFLLRLAPAAFAALYRRYARRSYGVQ
jgi:hypothetical protein